MTHPTAVTKWSADQFRSIGLSVLVILSAIAMGVFFLGAGAGVGTAATTITVDDGGGAAHTSIQAAVDNASAGDTVEVQPGTYNETVSIDKNITVIAPQGATLDRGATPDRTFPLQPDPESSAFVIGAHAEPTIDGFTIRQYRGAAIYAFGSTGDWTLRDLVIQNVSIGLGASGSEGAWVLERVQIDDATTGGYADDTTNAFTIRDSAIRSSVVGFSAFQAGGDWTIQNTTVSNNDNIGITAINSTGAWSIHESHFTGNGPAINATGAAPRGSATRNWWGACDGPSGDFPGSGDGAIGNLSVEPFYTDEAQTELSNETTSSCDSNHPFDVGVELEQSETVTQGGDTTITAYVNNRVDQSVPDVSVALLVDANEDGQITSSERVASRTIDLGASEYRSVNLTYTNVQLAAGDYTYLAEASKDGQTVQSFTNGTLTVDSGSISPNGTVDIALEPATQSVSIGGTTTYDVVVQNVDNGVGAYEFVFSAAHTSTATITGVTPQGTTSNSLTNVTISSDGSQATVVASNVDTADAGTVTVATVTVTGQAVGTTDLNLSLRNGNPPADESGNSYTVGTISNSTVTVSQTTGPGDLTGDGNAATDPDNDGVYEDINGDGSVTAADVTALFDLLLSGNLPADQSTLDINGNNDGVTAADVTTLFNEVLS